jgi:nitrate/TMAO reductase-like tetraheme cytochrome c subunit
MENEVITVICVTTLVILIGQIMVTLRLFLYLQNRVHEKNEGEDWCAFCHARKVVGEGTSQVSHSSDNVLVAGCPYAASSVYSNSIAGLPESKAGEDAATKRRQGEEMA